MQKFIPLRNRLLVRVDKTGDVKTASGVIIPATASPNVIIYGDVIAIGEGRLTDEGKLIPMKCKVGDKVAFSNYSGGSITLNEEKLMTISEDDVTGIITETEGE